MEIVLIVLAGICVIAGVLGSFLPILPGPPIGWLGLLLLHFTEKVQFSLTFLIVTALVTIFLTIFDYVLPSKMVKRKGGSKIGERGALIGAIVGMFFGPIGIIVGPFAGAMLGELIDKKGDFNNSMKIAFQSFIGFILSTGLKLIWGLLILFWYIKELVF
ncbi:MAG: DUF456 domain-containing protein [Brumimicrobium sp.]